MYRFYQVFSREALFEASFPFLRLVWSETLSTTNLGVLIRCLSNLRYVAGTVSLETPLEVLGQNIRAANSGASEPNFKRGVSGQFFAPD